jgi:hypothetical protein
MKWFLIAYLSSGLSVAVGPPHGYKSGPHGKELCSAMLGMLAVKTHMLKCEQHQKRPKPTGKVDREMQETLEQPCRDFGKACGMLEEDVEQGLPLQTNSMRFWKERERK